MEEMKKTQLLAKAMLVDRMSDKKIEEAEALLKELNEFKDKKPNELGQKSEMLFIQDHMCNIAIKAGQKSPAGGIKMKNPKTGMVHLIKCADDVIEFHEASQTVLTEQNKINPETPEQKAKREKENAIIVQKCKEKVEKRKYQKLTENIAGFNSAGDLEKRHAK